MTKPVPGTYRHDDLVGWRYYWDNVACVILAIWDALRRRPLQ